MSVQRSVLRNEIVELLDREARPDGDNGRLAGVRRYTLKANDGTDLQIMFQVYENQKTGRSAPPNIWFLKAAAKLMNTQKPAYKDYPASSINQRKPVTGRVTYGRHSGLKSMTQLAEADLLRFTPETIFEVEKLIAALKDYNQ